MDFDELLYDEIYAEDFSPRLKHFEYGTHSLEIFVTTVSLMKIFSREIGSVDDWKKDHDTAPSWKEELVPPGGLKEWLAEGRVPQTLDGHEVIGGLRLLCQFWKPSDEISKDKYVIPFKDEDTLRELLNTFRLPHCFPHDLIRRRYIPTRVQPIYRDGRNRMGLADSIVDWEIY